MKQLNRNLIAVIIIVLFKINFIGQNSVIDSLKHVALKTTIDSLKALNYSKISVEYWYINLDSSVKYTNKAYEISKNKKIKGIIPYCQNNFGVIEFLKGNYHAALSHYFDGLKYSSNNYKINRNLLNNIGMVYTELKDYSMANKYYLETLSLKKKNNDSTEFAGTFNNLGIMFNHLKQYEIAKKHFDSTYYYSKKFNDPYSEADALGNIANYYTRKKEYKNSEKYIKLSLELKLKLNDEYGLSTTYCDLGNLYLNLNNHKEAEKYLLLSEKLAVKNKYYDLLVPLYINLSDYYKKNGEYKNALHFVSKSISIKDSILSEGKLREAAIQENDYKNNIKQVADSIKNESELLKIQTLHESEIYKQQIIVKSAIIAAILLLIIALVILKALREKHKSKLIIEKQKQEVEIQKQIVEEHQKEILDSIHYAKRIQNTLLAHHDFLNENIPNNFVYFNPKDIVSGDFYWATKHDDNYYLAVCDSTGHGVPGAFMSLLNIGFLSEAINEKNITETNLIFEYVRERLISSVNKEGQKDGFDGIILRFNNKTNEISFTAANNAPILISNNELVELTKDKMPVGLGERKEHFTCHKLDVKKGDMLYLYTDGYADQFGGPKGKKFKYKPLNELLLSISNDTLEKQKQELESNFNKWKGELEQVDDVCIIGIRI